MHRPHAGTRNGDTNEKRRFEAFHVADQGFQQMAEKVTTADNGGPHKGPDGVEADEPNRPDIAGTQRKGEHRPQAVKKPKADDQRHLKPVDEVVGRIHLAAPQRAPLDQRIAMAWAMSSTALGFKAALNSPKLIK